MNGKEKKIFGLSINIFLLGLVSLLTDVSSEMIMPLLPLFIVLLGGAGLSIGIIGGFADAVASILQVFSGYWSDLLRKRKPFVFAGYGLSSVSKLFYFFSLSWWNIFILRALDRAGKGLREAPRDAMIAGYATDHVRGRAFGLHKAMDSAGAVIGAVFALVFFWFLGIEMRIIFLIAALFAFTALVPLLFVKEGAARKHTGKLSISISSLPKNFRLYLLAATVFALGNFTYMFFILKAQQFLAMPEQLSIAAVLGLYILFNIVYTLVSTPAGILSDRIGRRKVIAAGYATFAITCIGFAVSASLYAFAALFILYGFFHALIGGAQRAFAADFVGSEVRGTALGTYHMLTGFAALPAGIIAGFLYEFVAPAAAFYYGAAMAAIAIVLFAALVKAPGANK